MKKTPCTSCTSLACRSQKKDCYGIHDESAAQYQTGETRQMALNASSLIDNGRAGTLTRVEEVIEYCRGMDYQRIGVAYCFGMEKIAREFKDLLKKNGINPLIVVCTSGAVMEKTIDPTKTKETISCNPAAQALVLNRAAPDLVVSIGLCLGHDIIFNKILTIPHTVLVVKDRMFNHNPSLYFSSQKEKADTFLETMDNSFRMIKGDKLEALLSSGVKTTLIDHRSPQAFREAHLKNSLNITLSDLPGRYREINRTTPVICLCNGSVQSAYGVMFLSVKGFRECYNLSGGFSSWIRQNRPFVVQKKP